MFIHFLGGDLPKVFFFSCKRNGNQLIISLRLYRQTGIYEESARHRFMFNMNVNTVIKLHCYLCVKTFIVNEKRLRLKN